MLTLYAEELKAAMRTGRYSALFHCFWNGWTEALYENLVASYNRMLVR